MKRKRNKMSIQSIIYAGLLVLFSFTGVQAADCWESIYFQGFEINQEGWLDSTSDWYGTVTRIEDPSQSYEGDFYAIFEGDEESGPFSRFDGYRSVWPGKWKASLAIYLDPSWISGVGFDYSVAASGSDGNHLRDFIFHVTKDTSSNALLVAGSNTTNFAPREDLDTINHYEVATAGWYIFEHIFYEGDGYLHVAFNLRDDQGTLLFTEISGNIADTIIPSVVGGNRYAWFTFINVSDGIDVDSQDLSFEALCSLIIDGCETFVVDFSYEGQMISQRIQDIAASAKNHGKFVSDVVHLCNELMKAELITAEEKMAIIECAAESNLP